MECEGRLECESGKIFIKNANNVVLCFSAVRAPTIKLPFSYNQEKNRHIQDYRSIYAKTKLYLGEQIELPTDVRLDRLRAGKSDPGLYALYFQYGRYLLISSSRIGSLPANLQGIWSWELRAPWSSNYTTNINAQMNYWPAQVCNLQECLPPYFEFLRKLSEEGKIQLKFIIDAEDLYITTTQIAGIQQIL
jgi:alpha-L-fucosidase 2